VGVVAKESVIADRREDILAFMRALDKGVAFVRDNPEEANPIVAEKLGVSPEEAPEQLRTVRLFDIEDNKTIGFNPDDPLNVMDSLEFAAETSEAIGLIASPVDAANLYDASLVNAL
jgi:NitT/TauT family transport system substrate-binding protein